MLRNEKRKTYESLLPCAGITLIRFNGFNLSHYLKKVTAPRGICVKTGISPIHNFVKIKSFDEL